MIAIAESGSTKCEWVILDHQQNIITRFKTQGFNPYFHSTDFVETKLNQCENFMPLKGFINTVYFYGAGCSSDLLNQVIQKGLQKVFTNARIVVDHDLLAAAYSLYQGEPVISCILGTGSNSCYFDGEKLVEKVPALGFILGDEAGGSYFGKKLLSDYFYNRLPATMQCDFSQTFDLNWGEAVKKVYQNIHANVYLASFMPFLAKHKNETYVTDIVRHGMQQFISVHVACFRDMGNPKVGFVGTLAEIFSDILRAELKAQGFEPGRIIRNPIDNLVDYHMRYFEPVSVS